MQRAAILIGVRKAGPLPELQAVWQGVLGMREWARQQGIDSALITTITDENGKKVTPQLISDAVKAFVERGDLDQLIIYFAGHGVNIQYGEYWLLSDAIDDSNAAVNVKGSEERARYSSIPHVVFISDACRTAAQGIQGQGITGSIIFPNRPVPGPEKAVDLFYATTLGEPALEIANPADAAAGFRAMYTDAMLEALAGRHQEVLQPGDEAGVNLIRPRPLKRFLTGYLPLKVYQATHGANPRSQQPDARISSDDLAWISSVKATESPGLESFVPAASNDALQHADVAHRARSLTENATRSVIGMRNIDLEGVLGEVRFAAAIARPELELVSAQNDRFEQNVRVNAATFGPKHFETGSGFKVRGARVVSCESPSVPVAILDTDGTLVRAESSPTPAASVLLTLSNGSGVLLPALAGFLTGLTFEGHNLVDVAYEPSDNSERWPEYQARAGELRALRAVIAASSRSGTFRLEGEDADTLARQMQFAKGIDPSLALYAAQAYRDMGNRERLREMADFMRGDLGTCLYDIALLAGQIDERLDYRSGSVFPFLPMLSQTWPLLPAYEVRLPPTLEEISRHVSPDSLWTLFDADGVRLISQAIHEGNLR